MSALCRCGDEQEQHRRGTGGCREPECGCGRFEEDDGFAPERVGLSELNVAELFAEAKADHDREVELAARLAEAERGAAEVAMELAAVQLRHAREIREATQEREEACTLLLAAQRELVPTVDALEQAREEIEQLRAELERQADVLGAYDAWQCVGGLPHCGRRFYSDDAQCGHGPLTPVTVTISRRPAGDTPTENRSTTT